MRALLVLLGLASAPALALAAPIWGLTVKSPEGCVTSAELARLVEARVGQPVFGPSPDASVDAVVTRTETGWKAAVATVSRSGSVAGSRDVTVEGASCEALTPRLALVVELLVRAPPPPDLKTIPAGQSSTRTILVPVVKEVREAPRSPAPWIVVGAGVALSLAGGVLLGWSLSTYDALQAQRSSLLPETVLVTREQFDTLRWAYPASWTLLGTGVAATGVGLLLNLLSPRAPAAEIPASP